MGSRPRPCEGPRGRREGFQTGEEGAGAGQVWGGAGGGPDGDGGLGVGRGRTAVWVGGSLERPWAAVPIRPAGLAAARTLRSPWRGAQPVCAGRLPPNCLFSPLIPTEAASRPVK